MVAFFRLVFFFRLVLLKLLLLLFLLEILFFKSQLEKIVFRIQLELIQVPNLPPPPPTDIMDMDIIVVIVIDPTIYRIQAQALPPVNYGYMGHGNGVEMMKETILLCIKHRKCSDIAIGLVIAGHRLGKGEVMRRRGRGGWLCCFFFNFCVRFVSFLQERTTF